MAQIRLKINCFNYQADCEAHCFKYQVSAVPSISNGFTVIFLHMLLLSLNINEMPPFRTSFICEICSLLRKKKLISVIGEGDYYFPVLQYLLFDSLIVSIVANIYGNLTVEFFRSQNVYTEVIQILINFYIFNTSCEITEENTVVKTKRTQIKVGLRGFESHLPVVHLNFSFLF